MIDKRCVGCNHVEGNIEMGYCRVYDYPEVQHSRVQGCAMRTHDKPSLSEDPKRINPLKASKRSQEVKK